MIGSKIIMMGCYCNIISEVKLFFICLFVYLFFVFDCFVILHYIYIHCHSFSILTYQFHLIAIINLHSTRFWSTFIPTMEHEEQGTELIKGKKITNYVNEIFPQ